MNYFKKILWMSSSEKYFQWRGVAISLHVVRNTVAIDTLPVSLHTGFQLTCISI